MSSNNVPEDIIDRLTNSLFFALYGPDRQQNTREEIIISSEDSESDERGTTNESFEDDCFSEENIQNGEKNKNPSAGDSERTVGEDELSKHEDANEDDLDEDSSTNDSDVVDLDSNDEELFIKSDGKPICSRCNPPSSDFPDKYMYIIHRIRHFSVDHFICPICRQGFVKLTYCIDHELRAHREETRLNDKGFANAVSKILRSDKKNPTTVTVNTEKDIIYSDYAVASTSLYPYCGPPLNSLASSYAIQYYYGRVRGEDEEHSKTSSLDKIIENTVKCWKPQWESSRQEIQASSPSSSHAPNLDVNGSATGINCKSDGQPSDSSYASQISQKKRKKYKKRAKRVEVKSYCCTVCRFTCDLESEIKEHMQGQHPNFTDDQVLNYSVLPSLQSCSPVGKNMTNIGPPMKRTRYEVREDSDEVGLPGPSSSTSSISLVEPIEDRSTNEGDSLLGSIRNEPF